MNIFEYLSARQYPGRGILLGKTKSGKPAVAYFIMGRSENSRNRVFAKTGDGIKTQAYDPSKMTDPSLIIYHPVRKSGDTLIVTNGDQTDTIWQNGDYYAALKTRRFEPDEPNYTPRISGIIEANGSYKLSILKTQNGSDTCCCRYFYEYDAPQAGFGHFISTYEGFGEPVPSFTGEPVCIELDDYTAEDLSSAIWASLDGENKVSLYVRIGSDTCIINKNGENK